MTEMHRKCKDKGRIEDWKHKERSDHEDQHYTRSMNFIGWGVIEDSTRKVTSFSKYFILLLISSRTGCVLSVLEEFLMSS